jgi:L-threonylcarbamoyladenylate synthase
VSADPIGDAIDWLRDGGLLAYPTETVWGLGADARADAAVERLRSWKGRSDSAPISVLVCDADSLAELGFDVDAVALRLAGRFWPGPMTLVLRCRGGFASGVAREDGAVGVRCSSHPLAAHLARRLSDRGVGPITATSLNRSGEVAAHTRDEARALCAGDRGAPRLLAVERAEAGGGPESTVVDCTGARPRVLRWGALAESDLEPVFRELAVP